MWSFLCAVVILVVMWQAIGTCVTAWKPYRPTCVLGTLREQTRRRFIRDGDAPALGA